MKVKEANGKLCPFTDTKSFNGCDVSYCICELCMAWVYTNKYSKEDCRRNIELPTDEKEGYCSLTRKENDE